jgi:hypothetical protein
MPDELSTDLREGLRGRVVTRGDPDYDEVRALYKRNDR